MVNYANGKVYRLVNNVDEKFYIGSTCNPLHKRKNGHKRDAIKSPEQPVYKHLNTVGWENVEIILIESYPCNSKAELEARERFWIELMKPELNKAIPTRTPKERYQATPEKFIQKAKKRYEMKSEEILQQKKKYYVAKSNEILQQQKKYYQENKEKFAQKYKVQKAQKGTNSSSQNFKVYNRLIFRRVREKVWEIFEEGAKKWNRRKVKE